MNTQPNSIYLRRNNKKRPRKRKKRPRSNTLFPEKTPVLPPLRQPIFFPRTLSRRRRTLCKRGVAGPRESTRRQRDRGRKVGGFWAVAFGFRKLTGCPFHVFFISFYSRYRGFRKWCFQFANRIIARVSMVARSLSKESYFLFTVNH